MNNDRFFLERKNDTRTFPIFDDVTPVSKTNLWLLVILVPLAFIVALVPDMLWPNIAKMTLNSWQQIMLIIWQDILPFALIVFLLHMLARQTLRSFFKKLTWHDIGDGIVALILGNVYAILMSEILRSISKNLMASNAAEQNLRSSLSKSTLVNNYISLVITDILELLNEELLAIIPMLAVATLAYKYYGRSRKNAIGLGLLASIIIFGLAHFFAYDWHIVQMLLVIGMSRLFDTGVYIRTKNLWVSYIAHYLWDAVSFGVVLLASLGKG